GLGAWKSGLDRRERQRPRGREVPDRDAVSEVEPFAVGPHLLERDGLDRGLEAAQEAGRGDGGPGLGTEQRERALEAPGAIPREREGRETAAPFGAQTQALPAEGGPDREEGDRDLEVAELLEGREREEQERRERDRKRGPRSLVASAREEEQRQDGPQPAKRAPGIPDEGAPRKPAETRVGQEGGEREEAREGRSPRPEVEEADGEQDTGEKAAGDETEGRGAAGRRSVQREAEQRHEDHPLAPAHREGAGGERAGRRRPPGRLRAV